jgi:hypothetical protein
MSKPTGILETLIGPVHYTMTYATYVFLHTDSGEDEVVTIRGVPYHVSYRCHLIDGSWRPDGYHDLHLSRKDHSNKDPSRPALKTAEAVLSTAWTEHLAAHPELSLAAAKASAQEEFDRIGSEVADLRAKWKAAVGKMKAVRNRLVKLERQ